MHLNVNNMEIFTRDDTLSDRVLKTIIIVLTVLLFVNAIFGYFISLNRSSFGRDTASWPTFCFFVVIFYLAIKAVSFAGFVALVYRLERIQLVASCSFGVLFVFGLLNPGLRANTFAFILLPFASMAYAVKFLRARIIAQCEATHIDHTCRGECVRREMVRSIDDRLFGGRGTVTGFFGYERHEWRASVGPVSANSDTAVTFAPNDNSRDAIRDNGDIATITTKNESAELRHGPSGDNTLLSLGGVGVDGDRPQTGQASGSGEQLSHLDAKSLLTI